MLVLCDACRRHVKVEDALCPFCGSDRRASTASTKMRGRSRAQRYALGAAIAASIGIAKASGQEAAPRAVAPPPSASSTPIASDDAGPPVASPNPNEPPDWRMQQHRPGGGCVSTGGCCGGPAKMTCPPYGCVFPDEACDIIRV